MSSVAAVAFAALLATAPSATPQQFDLVCTGSQEQENLAAMAMETTPFTLELRVDLQANVYCEGECQGPVPIKAIYPAGISFIDTNEQKDPQLPTESEFVNRSTGKYISSLIGPQGSREMLVRHGDCAVAPFKGVPHPATKF